MDPPAPRTPPSPQWVVLHRLPRCDLGLSKDAGISLELDAPPRITQLVGPPSLLDGSGGIVAADPSGVLLLSGSYGSAADPVATDQSTSAPFLLWDAISKITHRLPIPEAHMDDDDIGTAGLIVVPGDFGHLDMMVASLVLSSNFDGDYGTAILRCFSLPTTDAGKWITKTLRSPRTKFPWRSAHVLSHKERLWWVDPLQGLLVCDPFANELVLHFVRLPSCFSLARGDEQNLRKGLSQDRCVNISCGKLRLAVITRRTSAPKIKLWTLADPESGKWTLNYEVPLEQIWDDQSYQTTGLPKARPEITLIHSTKPHVLYLFLGQCLFSVDLQTKMVIEIASNVICDNSLLAWELPPSLRATSSDSSSGEDYDFDTIADSFCSAFARELADMEFQKLASLALGTINMTKKKKENKFKLPEYRSICYFDEIDAAKQKKYVHMNFYAHNSSGKALIFAELHTKFLGDHVNGHDNWTVSCCKILSKNCHGGLYCDDADLVQSKTKKRKKSLYCFVCEPEVLHPMSGFEGGYGGIANGAM